VKISKTAFPAIALILAGCSATGPGPYSGSEDLTRYRTGDIPFSYPESLLTGYGSSECLKWADSDIVATDSVFLFDAAGMSPVQADTLVKKLDREMRTLSASMDWAPYRWLDSLPVINQPNGAALFADSVVTLDRKLGSAKIPSDKQRASRASQPDSSRPLFITEKTTDADVMAYVLPEFEMKQDWRPPSHSVYQHFLKLSRDARVDAVRRYNLMAQYDVGSETYDILPGRILFCVVRNDAMRVAAEGHDMGVTLKAGASDQDIRDALVQSYQAARTRAYGQLGSLIPEWFLTGQRVYHSGGRIADIQEGLYGSPINSHGSAYSNKPANYDAISGLAYQYLGEANEMSLISSLLDSVRYRDMALPGTPQNHPQSVFADAFNQRMKALDGGPLTIRGFDYGWNGFIGTLR